ncbi:DUF3501 family protein [Immundisolibacter sp.]|uniref:DUF3501 family protein n=1 Tax=Immundisolibacter sp. TaxID=1934948 RepID=UPI00262889A2|nr:DUF3501 family protein [Immundisolibacter sp.]MDD3651299.1 DUF3501 family protein [Immundisolibacter sp.]
MQKLTRADLLSLEQYAEQRPAFRARVLEHKKPRQVRLGPHATLIFEDRLTIHYQIQEMLRAERIFEARGIQDELDAYNPLIPDGSNLKATFMLEYADEAERRRELAKLIGVEDRVWLRVAGHEPVYAIADEDLERENDEKTSSVHFLRFELTPAMIAALKGGAPLAAGIDHPNMTVTVDPLPAATRDALVADLDG